MSTEVGGNMTITTYRTGSFIDLPSTMYVSISAPGKYSGEIWGVADRVFLEKHKGIKVYKLIFY